MTVGAATTPSLFGRNATRPFSVGSFVSWLEEHGDSNQQPSAQLHVARFLSSWTSSSSSSNKEGTATNQHRQLVRPRGWNMPTTTPTSTQRSFSSNDDDPTLFDFDYIVIGGGSGGIASARRAATYGAKVAIVESNRWGGTCVNVGCVPKKIMWNAASIAETLHHDLPHYGFFNTNKPSFDWSVLKDHRDRYIQRLNGIYEQNLRNSNIVYMQGMASLGADAHSIVVSDGDDDDDDDASTTYTANHILIATGGYPKVPFGDGMEYAIDSDGFFEVEELPKKVVVVGAGYIAVEVAGVLNALGSDTTLVVRKESALRDFDDILKHTLDDEMQKQGITICRNTNGVERVTLSNEESGLKTVHLQNGHVIEDVNEIIMAAGRAPLVEPLNLPAQGVKQEAKGGYIVTDEYSNTNVPGIYALGDVCGKVELTPMAIAAGRRLADRLFGPDDTWKNAKVSYDLVPTVVFSHPPIGTIGLTEAKAMDKYGETNINVYKSTFSNLHYGPWQVDPAEKPKTAMKLVCAGPEELVVGLHVIGMGADEMLQGFGIAMKMGATKADFDSTVAIHPTAAEEFVTMFPWGLSEQSSGAVQSPLNGAPNPEPSTTS